MLQWANASVISYVNRLRHFMQEHGTEEGGEDEGVLKFQLPLFYYLKAEGQKGWCDESGFFSSYL